MAEAAASSPSPCYVRFSGGDLELSGTYRLSVHCHGSRRLLCRDAQVVRPHPWIPGNPRRLDSAAHNLRKEICGSRYANSPAGTAKSLRSHIGACFPFVRANEYLHCTGVALTE